MRSPEDVLNQKELDDHEYQIVTNLSDMLVHTNLYGAEQLQRLMLTRSAGDINEVLNKLTDDELCDAATAARRIKKIFEAYDSIITAEAEQRIVVALNEWFEDLLEEEND